MRVKSFFHIVILMATVTVCSAHGPGNKSTFDPVTGNWLMYFGSSKVHDKWSLHHEVQFRSHEILPNTEQWLLRGGLNYHITDKAIATGGYGYISNHYTDPDNRGVRSDEHRIWQQFITRNSVGRVNLEHRYRLEQRWLNAATTTYVNRARYFLRVTVPLTKPKLEPNTLFLSFYDEIFLHLTSSPFDRNRLYGAVGYQLSKNMAAQAGYLLQTVGNKTKPYTQVALFWNLDLRRSGSDE